MLQVGRDKVGLVASTPGSSPEDGPLDESQNPQARLDSYRHRPIYEYEMDHLSELREQLERDLPKVYCWQNVWRVSSALGRPTTADDCQGLRVDLRRLKGRDDRGDGEPFRQAQVHPGQYLSLQVDNLDGDEDVWVTVLLLDGQMGIDVLDAGSLQAGSRLRPIVFEITESSAGMEGVVVVALPVSKQAEPLRLAYLRQSPLGTGWGARAAVPKPRTPFERLMAAVATGKAIRGREIGAPTDPVLFAWSWITLPKSEDE